jgi:hypothetical protein
MVQHYILYWTLNLAKPDNLYRTETEIIPQHLQSMCDPGSRLILTWQETMKTCPPLLCSHHVTKLPKVTVFPIAAMGRLAIFFREDSFGWKSIDGEEVFRLLLFVKFYSPVNKIPDPALQRSVLSLTDLQVL